LIDAALVHWIKVAVGTLSYILNTHPDRVHSVHQLARIVHNPGPAHVKALDHILLYLAETVDLYWILANWTATDLWFLFCVHSNADASPKNMELDFRDYRYWRFCFRYSSARPLIRSRRDSASGIDRMLSIIRPGATTVVAP
jgi:hypothetical protein